MTGRLAGKTALIAGWARGIGGGFAEHFVQEGARVEVASANIEAAKKAVSEIGDAVIALPTDMTDQDRIETCVSDAANKSDSNSIANRWFLFNGADERRIRE